MRFTAQEEYGLRCLLQIARAPAGFTTIPEIAANEGLTVAYVAKLMRVLLKGGLVKSIRGQHGGYRLASAPEAIDMGTVMAVLGGRLYPDDFCEHFAGQRAICVHNSDCSIRSLWTILDAAVQSALSRITLRDLLCSEREMDDRIQAHTGLVPLPTPEHRSPVGCT